jgi:hypothetical protein
VIAIAETVTRTALLGVRFWDRVTGRAIADGLELVETRSGLHARSGPSGVFSFHDLPGLRASSFGAGDAPFWASPPVHTRFTFRLRDGARRFLPFRITDIDLPARGLFAEDCGPASALAGSPPDSVVGAVPLFSAPSRIVPGGIAAIRADLEDATTGQPAAWAVLEASAAGAPVYRGIADERGRVVVFLPYPEVPWHGSSPPPGSQPLSSQTWQVTLTVRYSPAGASPPFPDPAQGEPPDLCAVLTQSEGMMLGSASPDTQLGQQTLSFGRELVLRTPGRTVLLVHPA